MSGQLLTFPSDPKKAANVIRHKLTNGIYEAEFFFDSKTENIHWVISLVGDREIVLWGQAATMDAAEQATLWEMKMLNRRIAARA
jgi:hypothetical protein